MNEETQKSVSGVVDAAPAGEKYLLKTKKSIIQKLKLLAQHNSLLTVHFASGKYSLVSLILEVLPDKNLVILDYGPDEAINKKILGADRISFKATHEGVKVQFSAKKIIKARFKGLPVFAIPIPESFLWLQRRECYRVAIPLNSPVTCQVRFEDEEMVEYPVLDISTTGIAIVDAQLRFGEDVGPGYLLENCRLILPEFGEENVVLEVRYRVPLEKNNPAEGMRIGCAFTNLAYAGESRIRQYMQMVELQRRRVGKD